MQRARLARRRRTWENPKLRAVRVRESPEIEAGEEKQDQYGQGRSDGVRPSDAFVTPIDYPPPPASSRDWARPRYLRLVDDFLLRSLLTPVLVAFLTTLVVEYAAKPRLEARKARILRSRAEVDEFVYASQRLGLLAGALPTSVQLAQSPGLVEYAREAVTEFKIAAADATTVLSRFSIRYAVTHHEHISKTAMFLGHLRGRCQAALEDLPSSVDDLRQIAGDLQHFDVYFRVHLGLRDSQEPLVKRLFWQAATQPEYVQAANDALVRHGLAVSKTIRNEVAE